MELLYFILGSVFIIVGTPILSAIADMFESIFQLVMYKVAFKIWTYKKQMGVDEEEQEQEAQKIPMGFHSELIGTQIPSSSELEEQDQE